MRSATRYIVLFFVIAVLVIAGQVMLHVTRSAPRDSGRIAERELTINVLAPDEHVVSEVPAYRRAPRDYFRATKGILALTDKRLVFVGLKPRDLTTSADVPPTFDVREFAFDSLVSVDAGRAMLWLSKGVVIRSQGAKARLAVDAASWPDAQRIVSTMTGRRASAVAAGSSRQTLKARADQEWTQAVAAWKAQQLYTVQRGDALGSIATRWNITPERLQKLNQLPDFKIRVGQQLIVRDAM